jgi:hypothetical protein
MRQLAFLAVGLLALFLVGGSLMTPSTWQWSIANLQVKTHNLANEQKNEGVLGVGVGWSRLNFLTFDWARHTTSGAYEGKGGIVATATDFNIAGISPQGIWVRVRYRSTMDSQDKAKHRTTTFNRLIFIPAHGLASVAASPDVRITGSFEPSP